LEKSIFKIFFSKKKEQAWLNSLGTQGYLLTAINDSKYTFEISEEHKYSYSIEYMDCSPLSDTATEYYKSRENDSVTPLVSSGNWVYFAATDKDIEMTAEINKKNSKFYFWRSWYYFFFSLCGSILIGYQIFSINYLERIGHEGNGQIREMLDTSKTSGMLNGLLNVLKSIVNYLFELINMYFKLWTNIFGESDAVAVISIVAPIVLFLIFKAAFNIDQYIYFRTEASKLSAKNDSDDIIEEGENNAEQKI